MAEHKPERSAAWRRADRGADGLVLASWLVLVAVSLLLLGSPASRETLPPGTVPFEAARGETAQAPPVNGPDFYPWVRPERAGPLPVGITGWAPSPKPSSGGFLTRLSAPAQDPVFFASSYGNKDSFYGGDWMPDNIDARKGGAFLEVRRLTGAALPFSAAEMQSQGNYRYGRYEAVMQPARGSGLVTAFFTYTGPWFGDPHDEIDIEFLGSDTTKIHFNYFKDGKSIKPATFDLPFDAADRPHLYAFEWRPDGITWFVDGVPYYATQPGDPGVPEAAGKVLFSAWTGKPAMEGWHGKPTFRDGAGAQFNCVSFTPLGHATATCADGVQRAARRRGPRAR